VELNQALWYTAVTVTDSWWNKAMLCFKCC